MNFYIDVYLYIFWFNILYDLKLEIIKNIFLVSFFLFMFINYLLNNYMFDMNEVYIKNIYYNKC